MERTTLGGSGLRIPRVGIGCSRFGHRPAEREAIDMVEIAIDTGLNFFDTADVYTDGNSERILGRAIKGKRDQCVIATKFRHLPVSPGGSRKSIKVALDASLKRLNVDYVDLYQLHASDPSTPIEETIATLQDLVQEGKILYFGLCNINAWQAVDAYHVARVPGRAPLASVQLPINAIYTEAYQALKPVAQKFNIGLLASIPLARGLLGGSYSGANPPPTGHPLLGHKGQGYWNEAGLAVAERLSRVAKKLDRSTAQVAIELLLYFSEITCVLVGPSSREQLVACGKTVPGGLDKATVRFVLKGHCLEPD